MLWFIFGPTLTLESSLICSRVPIFGYFPEFVKWRGVLRLRWNRIYETTVSTVQTPPGPPARVPGPQEHQERPRHVAQSPPQRPQTPDARLMGHARRAIQAEIRPRDAHQARAGFFPRAAGWPASRPWLFDCQLAQTAGGRNAATGRGDQRQARQCGRSQPGQEAFTGGISQPST
jgi:hypothetical protein